MATSGKFTFKDKANKMAFKDRPIKMRKPAFSIYKKTKGKLSKRFRKAKTFIDVDKIFSNPDLLFDPSKIFIDAPPPPVRSTPPVGAPMKPPRILPDQSALKNRTQVHSIKNHYVVDERTFLDRCKKPVIKFLHLKQVKFQLYLFCEMRRDGGNIIEMKNFKSGKGYEITEGSDLSDIYDRMAENIIEEFAMLLQSGSGWSLERVVKLEIHFNRYNPLKGSA